MSTFGKRLKQLRNEHNLTQDELAKAIKISKSSINMYERDEREPKFETLEAIADYFNVDMDYLLGRSDEPNRIRSTTKDAVIDIHASGDILTSAAAILEYLEKMSPDEIHNVGIREVDGHDEQMLERTRLMFETLVTIKSLDPIKRRDLIRYMRFLASDQAGEE